MRLWKLFALAVGAWLVGLATMLTWLVLFVERPDMADVLGFGTLTLGAALIIIPLLYVPGLFWLRRRRGGCRPAWLFPVVCGVLLNLPVIAVSVLASRLKASMALGEQALFLTGFVMMGFAFGLGFVRYCRDVHRPSLTVVEEGGSE
jgi:hypothetical protein